MADVGKNIKEIRKEKNLTQDDLAERLHCTRQTISNYENGKSEPHIELLVEIAGVLDVEVNDLIWSWYMKNKIMKVQDSFSSSDIPHLIPMALEQVVFDIYLFSNGAEVWYCPLLGVAFAACRKMKN